QGHAQRFRASLLWRAHLWPLRHLRRRRRRQYAELLAQDRADRWRQASLGTGWTSPDRKVAGRCRIQAHAASVAGRDRRHPASPRYRGFEGTYADHEGMRWLLGAARPQAQSEGLQTAGDLTRRWAVV